MAVVASSTVVVHNSVETKKNEADAVKPKTSVEIEIEVKTPDTKEIDIVKPSKEIQADEINGIYFTQLFVEL